MKLHKRDSDKKKNNVNHESVKGKSGKLRKRILVISSVVIAMVLLTAGILYYQTYVAPSRQTVLTVDDTVIRMDYFLKRVKLTSSDPAALLEQLAYEQIINKVAPQFGIEISQSDVDQTLRSMATVAAGNVSDNANPSKTTQMPDSEFLKWYSEQLKKTGLSDVEYREITRTNLMAARFKDYLATGIPSVAEQVHLHVMALVTFEDAEKAKTRIAAGEDFAAVASEVSVDAMSKASRGDLGWIPRGVIPYDDIVFQLEIDQVSEPVVIDPSNPTTSPYALFLVSEKDANRIVETYMMQVLSNREFYNWLEQEIPKHTIEYSYSAEAQAWVSKQLNKDRE